MAKTKTDLYRHFDKEGNLLYVGISLSAIGRLTNHRNQSKWYNKIANVTIQKFNSRAAAEKAEIKAIQVENPKYNTNRYKAQKKKRKPVKPKEKPSVVPVVSREERLAKFWVEFKAYKKLGEPLHGDMEDVTLDQVNTWAAEFKRLRREYPEFM